MSGDAIKKPPTTAAMMSAIKGKRSAEETIAVFNALRNEQRQIASKIFELENDLNEHKVVIETLKEVDGGRKCYRMIGGILVEGTVKEILPNLVTNSDQLKQTIEILNTKLVEKGKEILDYKEKNNIQFQVPEKKSWKRTSLERIARNLAKPLQLTLRRKGSFFQTKHNKVPSYVCNTSKMSILLLQDRFNNFASNNNQQYYLNPLTIQ